MGQWEINTGMSDEWYTPPAVFAALGCEFDLDVAAPPTGEAGWVPAKTFIRADSLSTPWSGFVWMNPPYGGRGALTPWLDKFFGHRNGIALVPDRTSSPWFWDAWGRCDAVLFTKRLRFLRPDGTTGVAPTNGSALFSCGVQGCDALKRARDAGFGLLASPAR